MIRTLSKWLFKPRKLTEFDKAEIVSQFQVPTQDVKRIRDAKQAVLHERLRGYVEARRVMR